MTKKIRVAVLFGGRSAEHEISILSARFVAASLDPERFEPVLVGIDKEGRFRLAEAAALLADTRDPRLLELNRRTAEVRFERAPEGAPGVALAASAPSGVLVGAGVEARGVDVVFPVLHGPMGEDGTIQGLLEVLGLPYVGSGVLGSAAGMDKHTMKRLLAEAELPQVPWAVVRRGAFERDWEGSLAPVFRAVRRDAPSWFVKPANLGSSVGISRVTGGSLEALHAAVREAFRYDEKVLIEQGIAGPREIECAVLEAPVQGGSDEEPQASIVGEIEVTHPDGFYSYAAKYIDEEGAVLRIPANLSPDQVRSVQLHAVRTFRALEASGLARVDFLLDPKDGELYVNEINTMPGFTAISMFPKLWEASGVGAQELVTRLVELALRRWERRRRFALV